MILSILGFLIPLLGVAFYFALKKRTPFRANSIGKGALMFFIVSVAVAAIGFLTGII